MQISKIFPWILGVLFIGFGMGAGRVAAQPGQQFEWNTASPESQYMSSRRLEALKDTLANRNTTGFLVIRHDNIVYEWYAEGAGRDKKHYTASLAKALVGGLSLGVAMNDGLIAPDDSAWKYIPAWKNDPLKSRITIRQLATHTAGIEDADMPEAHIPNQNDLPGWKGAFWRGRSAKNFRDMLDPFQIAIYQAPVIFEPGMNFAYSNPGMADLAYAVTASLRGRPQTDIRSLLRARIMEPIGIQENDWSIGYGRTFPVDGLPVVANWGGGSFTARAVARIGRLMLHHGQWEGKQLLSQEVVQQVTSYGGTALPPRPVGSPSPAPALGWYSNIDGVWPEVPRDAFCGSGAQQQILMVIPSLDLILVRNGGDLRTSGEHLSNHGAEERYLIGPMMKAVQDLDQIESAQGSSPYPPSPVIRRINWAPPETIVRRAHGSDNWPATWGDDGNLYTAYGDGWGFEPRVDHKLSLGLAKVLGDPHNLLGVNIRTETGEQVGDGKQGKKASGMLMVDGTLYMWARNAGNSRLAWSADHGDTWTWADWKFEESFGYPTFLNFGKNYAGARDAYVYVYSTDSESAYEPADDMILARVHRDSIRRRDAYTVFVRRDAAGQPIWSRAIADRGSVFAHPGRCYRSSVTYDAALDRYLWVQILPESPDDRGPRFAGGFGVYDAPDPWGPWTTVYSTPRWDVGPGETASFPTKWMSADGKTCYLLFSGDDAFSVRKAEFILQTTTDQ